MSNCSNSAPSLYDFPSYQQTCFGISPYNLKSAGVVAKTGSEIKLTVIKQIKNFIKFGFLN
ncbi:hypothetical protein PFLA_b0185 [Pseudoalteromonas flavipulchra NCIMB 2033 = ATCC BAA-314]|nr:hypothetical protein [Pseudoalteromonas flavipulchra NCIMB 2033 = ATCC BAA-314]